MSFDFVMENIKHGLEGHVKSVGGVDTAVVQEATWNTKRFER
jgi:hypothetical protein